jgi:hypothetical protein
MRSLSEALFVDRANPFGWFESIRGGEIRVLAGLDAGRLRDWAAGGALKRPMLAIDLAGGASVEAVIERTTAGLARTVSQLWPFLWDGEDFADARADALGALFLPIRLRALNRKLPGLSPLWAQGAVSRLHEGRLMQRLLRRARCRLAASDRILSEKTQRVQAHGAKGRQNRRRVDGNSRPYHDSNPHEMTQNVNGAGHFHEWIITPQKIFIFDNRSKKLNLLFM